MIHEKVKRKTSLFVSNTWYLYQVYGWISAVEDNVHNCKKWPKENDNDKDLEEIKISIDKQA